MDLQNRAEAGSDGHDESVLNPEMPNETDLTKKERRHPDLLKGSRRARIARGSGTQPADVNKLLKQYQQMEKMMSKLGSGGMKGLMRQMSGAMRGMGGAGLPRCA